jgi:hemolysin III
LFVQRLVHQIRCAALYDATGSQGMCNVPVTSFGEGRGQRSSQTVQKDQATYSWWSREQRPYTPAELIVDGVVHVLGLIVAIAAGSVLLAFAILETAPEAVPALAVYVGSLIAVLGVSLAYNLWPVSPVKMLLARFDQAAIFLFIAGTYTPFLAVLGGTTTGILMTTFVWGASLIGLFIMRSIATPPPFRK